MNKRRVVRWLALGLGCCSTPWALAADQLPTVKVVDSAISPLETAADLESRRHDVPGGTNLVDLDDAVGLSTLSAALNYQPGIIVQEFFGGFDQPRLNVRGSGIQGNPVTRGVLLRQDHLPLNEADGSFIIGVLDLRNTAMVGIHRGANSRVPGSTTLGGDLNFVSWDGATGTRLQLEGGSHDTRAVHAGHAGATGGGILYRAAATHERSDGFRHHSESEREHYALALSAPVGDEAVMQWYLNHTAIDFDMPFVLTRARAESDPRSVFGDGDLPFDAAVNIYRRDPHRSTTQTRIASRTRVLTQNGEHSGGFYWQSTDDAFVDPFTHTETDTRTAGLQWIYDHVVSQSLSWQLGIDFSHSDMPRTLTGNDPMTGNKTGAAFADLDLAAQNRALSLQADIVLRPGLTLNAQWQWGTASRDIDDDSGALQQRNTWLYDLPKLGLVYRAGPHRRWYANVSRSIEMPTFWELVGVNVNPALTQLSTAHVQEIDVQKAVSFEAGVETRIAPAIQMQATIYRSHIRDELISTASQFGVIAETANYEHRTVHQGLELGLHGSHTLSALQLAYRLGWTWSDFYFDGGVFDGNRIAGVPENLLQLELLATLGAWQFGPNVRWLPDNNPVDHANTLGQGNYAIAGFKVDYRFDDALRVYAVFDNITDEKYNAAFVVRAQSSADMPTYLPGNGASALLGISVEF